MTNISVDDLKLVNLIATQGSFAKAADTMNMTRPSVSRRIKAIEDNLQIMLFKRTTRQLELTFEGQRFIEHTMAMEQQWIQALGEIQTQKFEPSGKLTVWSQDLINRRLAKHCLLDFLNQYPKVDLTLLTSHGLPDSKKFEADIMLHISPLDDQAFINEPLVLCHRRFYASPAYLAKNGVPQHPRELGAFHVIEYYESVREREIGYWTWTEDELLHKVKINSRLQCDDMEVAMQMALNDYGIVWLPDFMCQEYIADGRLVALFDGKFAMTRALYAIYPKNPYCPSTTQAFNHFMRYNKLLGVPLPPKTNGLNLP